ncbi:MAG: hypothetical protein U0559_18385 [Anaerolineae bacterium]
MNRLALQLGTWSAFLIAVDFILYTVCFVATLLSPPIFVWTTLTNYAAYATTHNSFFKDAAMYLILIFGPLLAVLLASLHEYARPAQKILTRLSLMFGLAFVVLSSINYFVQLSIVRQSILHGQLTGLEQVVQANPMSAMTGLNMLGWSIFLGLASLFAAPIFSGGRLEKAIKALWVLNGLCCLLGGLSYIYEFSLGVFLFITLGMGGAVTAAAFLSGVWFRRLSRSSAVAA